MVSVSIRQDAKLEAGYNLYLEDCRLPLAKAIYPKIIAKLMAAVNFLLIGGLHAECRFFHEQGDKMLVLDRKPEGVQLSVFTLPDSRQRRRPCYSEKPDFCCITDLEAFARDLNRDIRNVISYASPDSLTDRR